MYIYCAEHYSMFGYMIRYMILVAESPTPAPTHHGAAPHWSTRLSTKYSKSISIIVSKCCNCDFIDISVLYCERRAQILVPVHISLLEYAKWSYA